MCVIMFEIEKPNSIILIIIPSSRFSIKTWSFMKFSGSYAKEEKVIIILLFFIFFNCINILNLVHCNFIKNVISFLYDKWHISIIIMIKVKENSYSIERLKKIKIESCHPIDLYYNHLGSFQGIVYKFAIWLVQN